MNNFETIFALQGCPVRVATRLKWFSERVVFDDTQQEILDQSVGHVALLLAENF